jgi:hypothetical protein
MHSFTGDDVQHGTVAALMDFPLQIAHDMQRAQLRQSRVDGGGLDRLAYNLNQGMAVFGAYTGIGCWELAAHFVELGLDMSALIPARSEALASKPRTVFVGAWDIKPECQEILTGMGHDMKYRHVFGNIEDKVSASARAILEEMSVLTKPADAAVTVSQEEKKRVFDAVLAALYDLEKQGLLFNQESRRDCKACGKCCHIWDVQDDEVDLIKVVLGSPVCTDCSSMNQSRQGVLGESGFSLMIFVMELRFRLPAVVLTECPTCSTCAPSQWRLVTSGGGATAGGDSAFSFCAMAPS